MSKKSRKEGSFIDVAGNLCTYREDGRLRVTTVNEEPSMTIQSDKDSCDINKILSTFNSTGVMSNIRTDEPFSGDFSGVTDFQSAMNAVVAAQDAFMELPADVRKRFNNDPGQLIDFLGDPQNRSEAVKLGLVAGAEATGTSQNSTTPPNPEGGQNMSEQAST